MGEVTGLPGWRVLLTRPAEDAVAWAARLRALGAEPVVFPCVTTEVIADDETRRTLAEAIAWADWMLLFSRTAVQCVSRLLAHAVPGEVRIAAGGPRTADAARKAFGHVDALASNGTARELARAVLPFRPRRVVVVGAANGRTDADDVLRAADVEVRRCNVYRTVPAPHTGLRDDAESSDRTSQEEKADVAASHATAIWFASPSAVEGFLNRGGRTGNAVVISIGPTTSEAADSAGMHVGAEAHAPTFDAMVAATLKCGVVVP
jgi:uroporphyrinogen-III synthase